MSNVPDAWDDEWSTAIDKDADPSTDPEAKKVSSKVTKAQKRAQQAEFNRQLWAEAEGPKETNYFLESRNVPPLRSEFKPPPILLSRKGPIIQSSKPPTGDFSNLILRRDESSEDEEDIKAKELSLAQRQAQAARDREEKQRKYEERRQELFGTPSANPVQANKSGTSTPGSLTPPGSRSSTPSRGRGKPRRGGSGAGPRTQSRSQQRELFDQNYMPKPDSAYVQRQHQHDGAIPSPGVRSPDIQPIRAPRGPDGSGRGGFGFAHATRPVVAKRTTLNGDAPAFTPAS